MRIESRYNGPPGSGNGGWSAGLFAAESGPGPVEVTLRRPPPLETPLTLVDGEVRDPAGEVVAEVRPGAPVDAVVPPVDRATAVDAAARYPGLVEHPFPGCYVCGPERADGLRIFPGRLPDGRTAAPFRAPEQVGGATVWAALDCPGGWSVIAPGRPYVLGRMAARLIALPEPGDECVVTGVTVSVEGRKARVHSSLYGPDGALLASARATWIALPSGADRA
ncbi:PaaI family thioesterase [Micromonospora musae]|uniref:PaaI family thioesterase n=1 Tax=Micromonospora musae TaxID=1894970 RepID=UPI00343D050A